MAMSAKKQYSDEDLIEWLIVWREEYGEWPRFFDFTYAEDAPFPTAVTYQRRFGSWSDAKEIAKYVYDDS